jgi:hypothetical protein
MLRASFGVEVWRSLRVGVGAEVSGIWHGVLNVVEPFVGAQLSYAVVRLSAMTFNVGVEGGALDHVAWVAQQAAVNVLTARVGLPLELAGTRWGWAVRVTPYVRMTPILHRVDGQAVFDAERVGVSAALSYCWH